MRDGAVSAARTRLFADAARLFSKAHGVLVAEGQHPGLAVGMQVDLALVLWEMGDRLTALSSLADALDAVEVLDPVASRQNERAHQFARASVGLFWHRLDPYLSGPARDITIGQASALSGDEALLGVDLKPLAHNRRILALCEIELGLDLGIERRSLAQQSGPGLASVEMFIAMALYSRAITSGSNFAEALRLGLIALCAYQTTKRFREGDINADQTSRSPTEIIQVLTQEGLGDLLKTLPVDLLLWQRFCSTWDAGFIERIEAGCIEAWGDIGPVADIISAASSGAASGVPFTTVALAASLATIPDLKGNPRAHFERYFLLVSHTAHSLARRVLEPVVVPIVAEGWSTVLDNEGFALRSPVQHRPAAAIKEMPTLGLKAAARLLLAAAPAVQASLSGSWERLLRQISGSAAQSDQAAV